MRLRFVVSWLALAACGGDGEEPPAREGPALAAIATAAAPDDVVVAQVDGRPVWGSCVAMQAARGADRRTALDECVAFELLAQAAEARGLAAAPEVADAARTALVDRLVATDFEARYRAPDDLAGAIDKVIERNRARMDLPEARASAFVRLELPAKAPPEAEAKARALAERIAAALADERGLFLVNLRETATRLAAGTGLTPKVEAVPLYLRPGLVPAYADALFAIPEVGRTAPSPVRTKWGWDVILLTELQPPKRYTRDEIAREAFPELRRGYFAVWVNGIVRALGVTIEVDAAPLARLEEGGP